MPLDPRAKLDRALARREMSGEAARLQWETLGSGEGWSVGDVLCTTRRDDPAYEESHEAVGIALVVAGSFQYRTPSGRALLSPGSLLLWNPHEPFRCTHDHSSGDRCVSFNYSAEFFETIVGDIDRSRGSTRFRRSTLPAQASLSALVSRAIAGIVGQPDNRRWEELAIELAGRAATLAEHRSDAPESPPAAEARVTRAIRSIESRLADPTLSLQELAGEAGLSQYHFLRIFRRVVGDTPYAYLKRLRLRRAGEKLLSGSAPVIDIAFDCGFGDVSNFNRAFRGEFGVTPGVFRSQRVVNGEIR